MRKIYLLAAFLLNVLCLQAQLSPLTFSVSRNTDKTYSIYVDNNSFATYTVKITFTQLVGYTSAFTKEPFANAHTGRTEIVRLQPESSASNFSVSYRTSYYPVTTFSKQPDSSVVYLLPATKGTLLHVMKTGTIEERLGKEKPEGRYGVNFYYKQNDTICAARAGVVTSTKDEVKEGEKKGEVYTNNRNQINIEHKDGTVGTYSMTAPIKLLIAEGDHVVPGQPIAVFETPSPKYGVIFQVAYIDRAKLVDNIDRTDVFKKSYMTTVPLFAMGENDHHSIQKNEIVQVKYEDAVISAELTRREKKKLGLK